MKQRKSTNQHKSEANKDSAPTTTTTRGGTQNASHKRDFSHLVEANSSTETGRQAIKSFVYICSGCNKPIKRDKFLLKACDKFWHENCLRCDRCQSRLGELGSSLFCKASMNLCRQDYLEMFGETGICSVCEKLIHASETVMRAKQNVYHLECFACQICNQRFCVGDRFYLCENKVVCQYDYEEHILPLQQTLLAGGSKSNSSLMTTESLAELLAPIAQPSTSGPPSACMAAQSRELESSGNLETLPSPSSSSSSAAAAAAAAAVSSLPARTVSLAAEIAQESTDAKQSRCEGVTRFADESTVVSTAGGTAAVDTTLAPLSVAVVEQTNRIDELNLGHNVSEALLSDENSQNNDGQAEEAAASKKGAPESEQNHGNASGKLNKHDSPQD